MNRVIGQRPIVSMNFIRKSRWLKVIAAVLTLCFLAEIGSPSIAWALTSGPGQPEFSSFEPVTTTNMVDPFTGAFTYNLPVMDVPGPNGGGYAVSMSYHSGVTPEEESSWCGLGWTLNPGAINRHMRGIPDDNNGNQVTYFQKSRPDRTINIAGRLTVETFSGDPVTFSKGLRYNNYRGFGGSTSVGSSFTTGIATLNITLDNNGSRSYAVSINPSGRALRKAKRAMKKAQVDRLELKDELKDAPMKEWSNLLAKLKKNKVELEASRANVSRLSKTPSFGSNFSNNSTFPTVSSKMKGSSISFAINAQGDPMVVNLGPEGGISAAFSVRKPEDSHYPISTYGAMYPSNGTVDVLNDYQTEKDGPFDQRDFMLPIPFHQKDAFFVSGEGVRGGFQVHQRNLGHYRAQSIESDFPIADAGVDVALGLDALMGANVGGGNQRLTQGSWTDEGNTTNYQFSSDGDEPFFFRYSNDLGGNVRYTDTDDPVAAEVTLGFQAEEPTDDKHLYYPKINNLATSLEDTRVGRSSYLGFNTFDDVNRTIEGKDGEQLHFRAFSKDGKYFEPGLVNRNGAQLAGTALAEFVTTNNQGMDYVYGLPVYGADETSVAFSTDREQPTNDNKIIYNDQVSSVLAENALDESAVESMEGYSMHDPYAHSFLLTEIHTPDYIDRTFDGPTNDDFGGWTKFNYTRVAGSDDKTQDHEDWYRWRMPYQGLSYARNSLSDPRDDRGSVSSGVKELYYLKSIETKTHIAFFITNKSEAEYEHVDGTRFDHLMKGSQTDRLDGREAPSESDALSESATVGTKATRKLERIVLFAKNDEGKIVGKPLKVAQMEYDYSLCQGVSNNVHSPGNTGLAKERGKLTLKKLWFEYEGITSPRIRPYEFTYNYKVATDFSSDIQAKYPDIVNYNHFEADPTLAELKENPTYNMYQVDGWGNHRKEGQNRQMDMEPWVKQTLTDQDDPLTYDFDPAAWNLKQIKLPSGGEILVQYEQHEYAKVMNEQAAQMVEIKERKMDVNFNLNDGGVRQERFRLNKEDLDMDYDGDGTTSSTEIQRYRSEVDDYIDRNNGIYFKILYGLNGQNFNPSVEHCNVEYITGYVQAKCVEENGELWIETKGKDHQIPKKICQDFYQKNREGMSMSQDCSLDPEESSFNRGAVQAVKAMLQISRQLADPQVTAKLLVCKYIAEEHSFFRMPVPIKKKGGGIRVKRILMHDKGIDTGNDEVLYGTEFFYQHLDGTCSGVASNEPATLREENTLIQSFDKREESKTKAFGRFILFGPDRDQFEGPYGESILPGASIGYQSVISQNIHTGKTAPGFKQEEFHTYAEDGLSLVNPDNWKVTDIDLRKFTMPMVSIYNSGVGRKRTWAAQGYAFVQHDMHGKLKKVTQYAGSFTDPNNTDPLVQSYTAYNYSYPGEKLPVMGKDGIIREDQSIGEEEEIAMAMSEVKDRFFKAGAEVDFGATTTPPTIIPNGSLWPFAQNNYTSHARHVISKVIRYTTVLRSTTSMTDGIVHTTENLVFDGNTGDPVVVRTSDGYEGRYIASESTAHVGKYINYTVPAAHIYNQMGQIAQNDNFSIDGTFQLHDDCMHAMQNKKWLGDDPVCLQHNAYLGFGTGTALATAVSEGRLVEGDLVRLSTNDDQQALFYISEVDQSHKFRLGLQPLSIASNALVDEPEQAVFHALEVVKSGYSNQLTASTASLTTYGDENYKSGGIIERVNDQVKLKDNLTNVIAAAATAYSDDWYDYDLTTVYDNVDFDCENPQSIEKGTKGKWRPKRSFVYKEEVSQSTANHDDGIYEGGKYTLEHGFVFKDNPVNIYTSEEGIPSNTGEFTNEPEQHAKWVETNCVKMYSPHGEPLEEENALGIKSSAKFGYGENVPELVAANAPFTACAFESFETESGRNITSAKAHSGAQSLTLKPGKEIPLTTVEAPDAVDGNSDMLVKFWCHATEDVLHNVASHLKVSFSTDVQAANSAVATFTQVARVGEWTLVEATISGLTVAEDHYADDLGSLYFSEDEQTGRGPGIMYQVSITNASDAIIYIDDARVQPLHAEMTTYVYDPDNLRLLTSFDDQHFGLFYQYNAEGQLVRKLIETERGIKTVTETQYHVPSVSRDAN